MKRPRFVVCEKTSQWAVAFRWALAGSGIRVHETRGLAECGQVLQAFPASLLALELRRANLAELVRSLVQWRRCYPRSGALVLLPRELQACEWTLREAGALHVVHSQRDLSPAAGLVARFCQRAEPRESGIFNTIADRLPWGDA